MGILRYFREFERYLRMRILHLIFFRKSSDSSKVQRKQNTNCKKDHKTSHAFHTLQLFEEPGSPNEIKKAATRFKTDDL